MVEAGHVATEDGISEQPTHVLLVDGMVPPAAFANEVAHIQVRTLCCAVYMYQTMHRRWK